jgi:hypothetical protein
MGVLRLLLSCDCVFGNVQSELFGLMCCDACAHRRSTTCSTVPGPTISTLAATRAASEATARHHLGAMWCQCAAYACALCTHADARTHTRTHVHSRTKDLLIRWAQLNAFMPHFENGGDNQHRPVCARACVCVCCVTRESVAIA